MVYIFDLEESYSVPNQRQQIDVSKGILQDYTDIADLKAIHDYFTRLYHYRGTSLDKKKIMDEFQKMECNFAEVAKEFKLIEEIQRLYLSTGSLKQMNYYRNYELKE